MSGAAQGAGRQVAVARGAGSGGAPLVTRGDAAVRLLHDPAFQAAWEELLRDCPWATSCQWPAFARTWYSVYAERFEPLVVHAGSGGPDGLSGLLLLAVNRQDGAVVHVGANQAEYQTWLARPEEADDFALAALRALHALQLTPLLRLLFLAPGTPLGWTARAEAAGLRLDIRWHRRARTRVGPDSGVPDLLNEKGNRVRLSRLKRLGEVRLEQVTTRKALEDVIDTIITQYDVRQGAVHGVIPFVADRLKRRFYLELMDQPNLMHAVVLRAGKHVVASHIGPGDGTSLILGLNTHAPQFGLYSPGKVLLLLLAERLGEQGYTWLDLTPGGTYKDRFASDYDEVAVLDVFLSARAFARHRLRRSAVASARRLEQLTRRDLETQAARLVRLSSRLVRTSPTRLARGAVGAARRWAGVRKEFRIYDWSLASGVPEAGEPPLRVNRIEDLLLYQPPAPTEPSLTEFLSTAVHRLEQGQVLFTAVDGGVLLHYSWLIPAASRGGTDYGHELPFEERRAVLWSDFTMPQARGRGLHQASLRQRLRHAAELGKVAHAVIGVRAENTPSRHNIEKVGFRYLGSAWYETRLGRARRWVDAALTAELGEHEAQN